MSSLSVTIFDTLKNNSDVSAIVGVRIYPEQIPQNAKYPCIVYHLLSDPSFNHHEGPANLADALMQFDCWAGSKATCETLAAKVRLALVGTRSGMLQGVFKAGERSMPPDPDTHMRRHVLDLRMFHAETT